MRQDVAKDFSLEELIVGEVLGISVTFSGFIHLNPHKKFNAENWAPVISIPKNQTKHKSLENLKAAA